MRNVALMLDDRRMEDRRQKVSGPRELRSEMPRTTIADVVSLDRRLSPTGLYTLERGQVRPLESLEDGRGKVVLAKTDGLTLEEKRDLHEQGVRLVYVREMPPMPGAHGIEAWYPTGDKPAHREQREMLDLSEGPVRDDIQLDKEGTRTVSFGTVIVPYIKLNPSQAESVSTLAQSLPEPEEEKAPQAPKLPESVPLACWYGYGGC